MTSNRNGFPRDRGAERARWVSKYRGSGLSLKEFAQRHGLSAGQLRYWVYGPVKAQGAEKPGLVFQEVRLPEASVPPVAWGAEVGLPNGTTVRLARGTDWAWAEALVECLRRPCLSR